MPEDNKNKEAPKHPGGRPPKYTSVTELESVITTYFEECDPHWIDEEYWDYPLINEEKLEGQPGGGALKRTRKRDYDAEMTLQTRKVRTEQQPYTMAGLARRLHLSRQGLMEYKAKGEFSDAIKHARSVVEEFNERLLLSNRNATGAIFNLKVNFQYKENEEENKPPENPVTFINLVPMPDDQPQPAQVQVQRTPAPVPPVEPDDEVDESAIINQ